LGDLSYNFLPGRFYSIQGPSGAGKTTLLRLINRLEEPQSGSVLFKGRPLTSYHPPQLRRSLMFVQQAPTLVDGSVRENLLMPFRFRANQDQIKPDNGRLQEFLEKLLLRGLRLDDNALALSVGQQQRLCFIRGLLLSPEVLLLDEPTSALDEESREVVERLAERQCSEQKRTVIMVSHRSFRPRIIEPVRLNLVNGKLEEAS